MNRRLRLAVKLRSALSNAPRSKRAENRATPWRMALFILLIFCSSRVEADDWHWLVGHHYAVDQTIVCLNKQAAIGLVRVNRQWSPQLSVGCIIAKLGGFYPSLRIANSKMNNDEFVLYLVAGLAMEIEGTREFSEQKYTNTNVYVLSSFEVVDAWGEAVSIDDPDFDK